MGGGEDGLVFYNPSRSLEFTTTWAEYATGAPYIGVLSRITLFYPISFLNEKLHIPNFILQAGTFFTLLVVGTISCYFLTLNLLGQHRFRHKIALVSAIFYLLNPFSISQIWGRSIYPQYFSFALLPISILIFIIGLKKRQYIFATFLILVSIIFSTAFEFVTFIMTYWLVLVLTFVYWLITSKQKRKDFLFGLSFFVLTFFLWVVAHLWWLGQYIPANTNNILSDRLGDSEANLNSLIGVSRSFTPDLVVRLLQRAYFSEIGYYGKIYVSLPFQLISLIIPFFAIWGLIKAIKVKKLKQFRFFVILFVLGLFVSLGANFPLGWLFVLIFKKITFLQPFRNPYEKFGLVYVLGYAPLFALGLVYFFERSGKKEALNHFFKDHFFQNRFKVWGLVTILILTCGIFVWPVWTGRIFAGSDKKIGVPIPSYYQDLSKFLDQTSKDYRVFMTPLWKEAIATYLWKDTIYLGLDPVLHLLNQPVVSNNFHNPYYCDFVSNIRRYMGRIDLAPALSLLRTKYLVDREDAIMIPDNEKLHYKYLTTAIQPPNDVSIVRRSVCQNMNVASRDTSTTRLTCQIPENEQDWQGVRYLHLEIKTDIASSLEVVIRDKKEVGNIWEGKVASEYQTDKDNWISIVIPIDDPTAYSYNNPIDHAHISFLDILAYPKDSGHTSAVNIDLKEVKLDPGKEVKTNEFSLIKTFGKLKLYEPNSFKSPPEFGTLQQINQVDDFVRLFQLANQKRDSIDQMGFLLISQNPNKDLSSLSEDTDTKIINKSKISETRYWIETEHSFKEEHLLLSKAFNPQWKVIPNISRDELNGSFGNDLRLLKKSYLSESNHYVVNGYANLWKVDGLTDGQAGKNGSYAVLFMPQILADLSLKVSVFSVLVMISFTTIWGIFKLFQFYPRKKLFV